MDDVEEFVCEIPENRYKVLKGRPWRDAVITLLEPRSPYRPWASEQLLEPGDSVLLVLATDPVTVLSPVATVGPDGAIESMLARIPPYRRELLELATVRMLALEDQIVEALDSCWRSGAAGRFGHTSLAAARTLLECAGRCTVCHCPLDLTGHGARDRVHVRTADEYADADQREDWPAVLCADCHDQMRDGGFASVVDFIFASHPRCPECHAGHTKSAMYGMPAYPVEEPWVSAMGCVVPGVPAEWVCGECRHQWQ